jgi:uncharacterized linocin/CFP29 family protein
MGEFLMRDAALLSEKEWEALDTTVVETVRKFLVGRRLLDLAGPFGPGVEMVPVGTGKERHYVPLTMIDEPFTLYWQDVEVSRAMGTHLELGKAARAAMACAKAEDDLILGGLWEQADKAVGLGDWSKAEGPLDSIVAATEALFGDGFLGPYAVVLSPALYTQTQRVSHGMGRMVSKLIADVAEGGLFRSQLLGETQGMVLSLGAFNFDIAIGQDLVTAYEGNEGLDHLFRVMETIALRVKRPGAICRLEG